MYAKNCLPVLLIEDSPEDIEFARRAFGKCGVVQPLVVAEDGEQALDWLAGRDEPPGAPGPLRPALVLLDLNIPGIQGRQVLQAIKTDPAIAQTPVVVLTSSRERADVERCYQAGANSYHCKSPDMREYQQTFQQITEYWLSSVEPAVLPGEPASATSLL